MNEDKLAQRLKEISNNPMKRAGYQKTTIKDWLGCLFLVAVLIAFIATCFAVPCVGIGAIGAIGVKLLFS
jgi:hypothetical protein